MGDQPTVLHSLAAYTDEAGNAVVGSRARAAEVRVTFRGGNNRLEVDDDANLDRLHIVFDCDDGVATIGPSTRSARLSLSIRVGQDGTVEIGRNVTSTEIVVISATEGTTVSVGNDVMFASQNQLRADDGHPIFDVRTGKRVNVSRSIRVGHHVWLGRGAVVLGGVTIGNGSVLGYGAVLTKSVPNNCIAAGVPAKVVRRDIAWERPHLSLTKPYYKPDAGTVKKSRYWNLTKDDTPPGLRTRLRRRLRRSRLGAAAARVVRRTDRRR